MYEMNDLIAGNVYIEMTPNGLAMQDFAKAEMNTIAPCNEAVPKDWWKKQSLVKEEGKTQMNTNFKVNAATVVNAPAVSIEATQRDFLVTRIRDIKEDHSRDLREQFHLDAENAPNTAKDLIDAIKNDKFTIDQSKIDKAVEEGRLGWYNSFFGIRWGTEKPDLDGYALASKALREATQDAIDVATLAPIEEATAYLKTFKEWKYEG